MPRKLDNYKGELPKCFSLLLNGCPRIEQTNDPTSHMLLGSIQGCS